MKTIVALALLALAACSPVPAGRAPLPYDVYAKPGQPQHVIDDARAEVTAWNAALRGRFGFDVLVWHEEGAPDPEACGTVVIGYGGRRGTHNGQASTDRADPCHLSINLSEAGYWNTTIAHEFGHVLGLEDEAFDESAEGVQSIMMQSTLNKEVLPRDVDAVCALWDVD